MRTIVTGVRDGASCVVEVIECPPPGNVMSSHEVMELNAKELSPRPEGRARFLDLQLPEGMIRWFRVNFSPNQTETMHHTDTIDCHTVVAGSIDLILDDGSHRLVAGDSAIVTGVDHGWCAGPQGCSISMLILGTPGPQHALSDGAESAGVTSYDPA